MKANLNTLRRVAPPSKTFEYDDGELHLSIEFRALAPPEYFAISRRYSALVADFITGESQPDGRPLELPPFGDPPLVLSPKDIDLDLLRVCARLETMQVSQDIMERYEATDFLKLAYLAPLAWVELLDEEEKLNARVFEKKGARADQDLTSPPTTPSTSEPLEPVSPPSDSTPNTSDFSSDTSNPSPPISGLSPSGSSPTDSADPSPIP